MQTKPLKFATQALALQYLKVYGSKKFQFPVEEYVAQSKLLQALKQRNLSDY